MIKALRKNGRIDLINLKLQKLNKIFNSYIDFFEPDFLVIPEGLKKNFCFDEERSLKLNRILPKDENHIYGLQASITYEYPYEDKVQFINQYRNLIIYPRIKTVKNNLLHA